MSLILPMLQLVIIEGFMDSIPDILTKVKAVIYNLLNMTGLDYGI